MGYIYTNTKPMKLHCPICKANWDKLLPLLPLIMRGDESIPEPWGHTDYGTFTDFHTNCEECGYRTRHTERGKRTLTAEETRLYGKPADPSTPYGTVPEGVKEGMETHRRLDAIAEASIELLQQNVSVPYSEESWRERPATDWERSTYLCDTVYPDRLP